MFEAVLAPAAIIADAEHSEPVVKTLPEAARRMLSAAFRLEDPAQLEAVVSAANLAFPEHGPAIAAHVAALQVPVEPLTVAPLVVTGTMPEPKDVSFLEYAEGRIDINAAYTDGNTETSSLGARLKASAKRRANIHRLEAYANTGSANQTRTQENWGLSYQMDTLWTEDVFGYVRGSFDSDQFTGFDYRAFLGAGAGYYFVNEDSLSVRGEVGPGYRYSRLQDDLRADHDWVLYGAVDSSWNLLDGWLLDHDSKVTLSEPTTSVSSRSHLSTALTDALRAGLSYEVQFEENPPVEKENLDTIVKFNVSYGF
ncbi:MAG: DUF481 domain-containing protein [Hyphomonadaceae bacterium]|nr:DUF481 domain-containing protein [Hyphomonadaceae bacterium]